MPHVVRLPAHVPDEEVRVYWDDTRDNGEDVHVWAPRSLRRFTLSHFCDKRPTVIAGLAEALDLRLRGVLIDEPSFLERMQALGYDPKTLVFSMRKNGAPAPEALPPDLRGAVENAQEASARLERAFDNISETKGVYVLDETEMEDFRKKLSQIAAALESAMDMMDDGKVVVSQD